MAALAGVMVGSLFLTSSPGVPRDTARPAPSGSPADDSLANSIAQLSDAVRRLADRIDAIESARDPAASRETAGPTEPGLADAAARLASAADALRSVAASLRPADAPIRHAEEPVDPGLLQKLAETPYDDVQRRHQMWTFQQVLDKFGPPTRVQFGGDPGIIQWVYEHPDRFNRTDFNFAGGHLIGTNRVGK